MYRNNRDRGGSSSYRSTSTSGPSTLGRLSTPSFSSITMLDKGGRSSSGGGWSESRGQGGFGTSGDGGGGRHSSQSWANADRGMGGGGRGNPERSMGGGHGNADRSMGGGHGNADRSMGGGRGNADRSMGGGRGNADRSMGSGRGQQQQQQQPLENVNASVFLDMDSAPTQFDAVTRVIGENGENLEYIRKTTGAQIQLQGRGTGIVNQKPLHIYIEHNQTRGLERAEKLAGDLVKVVQEEYIQWQETHQSSMGGSGSGSFNQGNQGGNQGNQFNQNRGGGGGRDNFNNLSGGQQNFTSTSRTGGASNQTFQDNQSNQRGMADNFSNNQRSDNRYNDGTRDSSSNRQMGRTGGQGGNYRGGGNQVQQSSGQSNRSNFPDNQDNFNRPAENFPQQDRNRGGGSSRDGGGGRTSTARLDAAGNWHQDDFNDKGNTPRSTGNYNLGRDQNQGRDNVNLARENLNISRDKMNLSRDNQTMGNRGAYDREDRNMDRGMDRAMDRGGSNRNMDRGMDRSMDQGMDQGLDRGVDRGMDRSMDRGNDRGMDQGMDRNVGRAAMDRGMDRNMDRGMDRNVDSGMDRNMDRGMDRNMDRGMDRNMDRGMDRNMDRGMDRNMDRGIDRNMDRGMDRSLDRGMDRSMDRGMDRNVDRGMDRNMDRGMDRNMDRGNNRNMERGMDRDRGMDRGMERPVERVVERNPEPPAPKPMYCDICDERFPHDSAYQKHCNGVYHAEMVLDIKARGQRAQHAQQMSSSGPAAAAPQAATKPQRQPQPLQMWTPDQEGMPEQRWIYNQVAPLYERQLEQDILKKLQEYCRSMVSRDEALPNRENMDLNNYCKLCKITFNDMRLHCGSNMHITYYILRQIQVGVDTFVNYYGDVPIANCNTNGGRTLALEALNWGPALPSPTMGKPQLVERFKKLVVLSGPRNGYKCDLCRARCGNMNFWVDHCTSAKHVKKLVAAMCGLTRDGFVREFPHTPVSPPYYAAASVPKIKDLKWHQDVQVANSSNMQRIPQPYDAQGEWFDVRNMASNSGGGRQRNAGPGGNRPPPLMGDSPRSAQGPGPQEQMRSPRPGQPRPLMDAPMPRMDTLSPADRELVMQVSQITGLQDMTLVMSALEALRALDPNMIGALGSLSTQAMADVDPQMIQTLLGAIGGGDAVAALAGGPGGPRGGPPMKRRMPPQELMGPGGPMKKGRF